MAEKSKVSDRDKTLISILERMADQLSRQEHLLGEIVENQGNLQRVVDSAEARRTALHKGSDGTLEKLRDEISRYRSDMLSLVNEQDVINKNLNEFGNSVNKTTFALEEADRKLANLDERAKAQEKVVHNQYELSVEQSEKIPREIADASQRIARLHAGTEKLFGELQRDTQRQLEKLQHETTRRLLMLDGLEKLQNETIRRISALDGIDAAMKILLVRTEPPEKKPVWIVSLFKKLSGSIRVKLAVLFKKPGSRAD